MVKKVIHGSFKKHEDKLISIIKNFDNEGAVFGNQNRNTIRVVEVGNLKLNIKSFRSPKLINKIAYGYFRKSKAERSYNYANKLIQLEIGTPQPIAYFEEKSILGLGKSFYISEHLDVDLTYKELVENPDYPEHEVILRGFTRFTHSLHENEVLFKDHSPGNTLIQKKEEGYHFGLVDLNRMEFKTLSFEERIQNFSRLTPKKEMVAVMSDEYAKITEKSYDEVFEAMWGATSRFQEKFFRKRRLKQKLKFFKRGK